MNGIHKFSAQVIDYAERLSDVADAAQGKNHSHRHAPSTQALAPASRLRRGSVRARQERCVLAPGEGSDRRCKDARLRAARRLDRTGTPDDRALVQPERRYAVTTGNSAEADCQPAAERRA
jgi:hypothetical protein